MRSCRIVESTPYRARKTGRGKRTFEIHIQVRTWVRRQPVNVQARAVDVGGKHVAATADTNHHTALQTMPTHGRRRTERAIQSLRDKKRKGGHAWRKYDKKLRIKRNKTNRIAKNARLQGAACIVRGTRYIIMEGLDIKAMMSHGGNYKRKMNDMMQLAGIGGFRGHIIWSAAKNGACIILVDPKNSSIECLLCSHIDKENRASRDEFICINCGDEAHADINAATVFLKRIMESVDEADGRVVLRRRAKPCNQPTQWSAWPRQRGVDPPHAWWGRQKITQVELLSGLWNFPQSIFSYTYTPNANTKSKI